MRSFLLLLLLALASAGPSRGVDAPAAAADAAEPSPSPTPTAESPVLLEHVEVTATLRPEERAEVPATVRTVYAAEARARHSESIAELLGTVPGAQAFTLGSPGQQTSLFVRGADSNQTMVLWNGIPLDDPFFGGFNFAFLPADGVARLEVVPGPFSALYGSSAMGGVVQVITDDTPGARAQLEAGEHEQRRVTLGAAGARGPLHGWLTGHWREGKGGAGNDHYDSHELAGRVGGGSATSEAALLARWNDSDTGIPFDGFTPSPHRTIDWREWQWAVPWSHGAASWDADGSVSQIRYRNRFDDPDLPFHEDTDSRVDRARAVATMRQLADGWWSVGGDWERQTVTDASDFGTSLDAARQRTVAAFTQLHGTLGIVTADVGLRYDDNDVYGSATSPRLGVVVAATSHLRLRASYGESFRAPALGELYFPFTGNPELRPERGRSGELGAQLADGAWSLDVALFRNRQHDLIDFDFTTGTNVNVGRARSQGGDAELRYARGAIDLRFGGMRLVAEDADTGRPLRNRPRTTAHLVAIARPGRAELALTTSYVGERVNVFPVFPFTDTRNPAYTTVDLAAGYAVHPHLAPYVRVSNLLDREYEPVLGFPAPGRTFVGGVRTEW